MQLPSPTLDVIDSDERHKEAMIYRAAQSGISDAILINAHYEFRPGEGKSHMRGLDLALDRVNDGRPIVIYSYFKPESAFIVLDARYHALKGFSHVEFVDVLDRDGFRPAYERAKTKARPEDPLAISLLNARQFQSRMAALQHDLKHAVKSGDLADWHKRARSEGLSGSDDEIVAYVNRATFQKHHPFRGERVRGVFCDVQGTLLDEKNQARPHVLAYLRTMSEHHPITLWTGGDVSQAQRLVSSCAPWKVVSKHLFAGAKIEIALDDQEREELEHAYRFTTDTFIKFPEELS